MKEKVNQRIVTKYNDFLKRNSYTYNEQEVNTPARRFQYYQTLEELVDTSKENAQCLTKEQTEIVRKYIGVYNKKQTITSIAEELGLSITSVSKKIDKISHILVLRILRGYPDLQKAVSSGEISKEELLKVELKSLDYSKMVCARTVAYSEYKTIGDIINNSTDIFSKELYMGETSKKLFIDYIHSLGLTFVGEKTEDTIDIKELVEESMKVLSSTLSTLRRLNQEEEQCNLEIQKQMERKKQIIALREELEEKMGLKYSTDAKVNKIGIIN